LQHPAQIVDGFAWIPSVFTRGILNLRFALNLSRRPDLVQALGRTLLVFVEIRLSSKSDEVFEKVRAAMQALPEVMECHLVSGSFDYLIKARLKGMSDYRSLLGNLLKNIPVPAESHSYVVMEEVKESIQLALMRS
jgi:Lrp/AsnC family leucine-responsive transcriptional regulator